MKRLILSILFFFLGLVAKSAIITWDGGGGDGMWTTAANWVGDIIPASSDIVVLDNSSFSGSYNVYLPNTSVTIISLRITPATGGIALYLPNTNTLATDAFVTTGTGYTVVIDINGSFLNEANVSSGTNLTIADSFRINDGGFYIHRTRSGHATWIQRLSKIGGTEHGNFIFDVPSASYLVSLSNRTYGALQFLTLTHAGPVNYSGGGASPLTINSSMDIGPNATLSLSMSADVVINEDLGVENSATFNLQNSTFNNVVKISGLFISQGNVTKTGTGLPQLQFCGKNNQSVVVTGAGSFTNNVEINVNNLKGITLGSPVTLPYKLTLTTGNVTTSLSNLLILADNATCSGGSLTGFVNGPMKKIGDDNFIFPVGFGDGSGNIYAPIAMINGTGQSTTDEFTAEYKRANPQSTNPYSSSHDPFLNHVSFMEYWTLQQNAGSATKQVSLDVHLASFCKDLSQTYVSRWNGSQWTYEPTTVTSGPIALGGGYVGGTIQNNLATSGFTSPNIGFTLATDLPFLSNPLPIKLVSFNSSKLTNNRSSITWELAACCSPVAKFEIQRADASKHFTTIETVGGNATNTAYTYFDIGLKNGINYYRLKMIDEDGTISYSRTLAIMNGLDGLLLTSLVPTIVTNTATLTIASSSSQKLDLIIVDMQGRTVMKRNYNISEGNTNIGLSLNQLPAGAYQLAGVSAEGKTNTIRFIK